VSHQAENVNPFEIFDETQERINILEGSMN
jgi:hypothetical protein